MGMFDFITQGIGALGSAVSTGTGIADTVAGWFGNSAADHARDDAWTKHKWDLNYMTPLNQRKRLEEAGLNPALMYGSGGMQSQMSATPNVVPVRTAGDNSKALEAFMEYALLDKRRELMDSQIAQNAQSVVTGQSVAKLNEQKFSDMVPQMINESKAREFGSLRATSRADEIFPSQLQASQQGVKKLNAEIAYIGQQTIGKRIENSNLDDKMKADIARIRQEVQNLMVDYKIKGEVLTAKEIENKVSKSLESYGITNKDSSLYKMIVTGMNDWINKVFN